MKKAAESQSRRVLIVDDDPVCRRFCVHIMESAGYLPLEADCAHQARMQIGLHHPHIILIDMHLPEMTACRFLSDVILTITDFKTSTLIIGMTGDDSTETLDSLYQAGCVDVLLKPFSAQTLLHSAGQIDPTTTPPHSSLELQKNFKHELDSILPAIDRSITDLDWELAGHILHRLAGAAAFSGYHDFGDTCRMLLEVLRKSDRQISDHPGNTLASIYLDLLSQASRINERISLTAASSPTKIERAMIE